MIIILIAVPVLDQLTKFLVNYYMEIGQSVPVIKGFFHITYIRNDGAAFGKFDDMRWLFMIGSVVALVAMAAFLITQRRTLDKLTKTSLCLIISGGFSNMIDRCFYGESLFNGTVIDFIDFCGIWQYIFNIADSAVVVGTGLMIIAIIMMEVKERRMSKAESSRPYVADVSEIIEENPVDEEK